MCMCAYEQEHIFANVRVSQLWYKCDKTKKIFCFRDNQPISSGNSGLRTILSPVSKAQILCLKNNSTELETLFFFLIINNFYFILFFLTGNKSFFLNLFIYGCVGSSFLCEGFLQLWQVGATLHCGAWAFHYCGLSCCGAQAPDAQAQQLWLTGPVAPRHVGFSQTRAQTRVPCIGRQILNHCATREALETLFVFTL